MRGLAGSSRRDVYAALEVLGCSPYGLTTGYAHSGISIRHP